MDNNFFGEQKVVGLKSQARINPLVVSKGVLAKANPCSSYFLSNQGLGGLQAP